MSYRLGVDVGGTFTDLVLVAPDGARGEDQRGARASGIRRGHRRAHTGAIEPAETARLRARSGAS
jgi:N-methylhydantoinase A/oxoprolinase/acetone carboxylase beta subunit